jgi:hypothetical protein
LQRDARLLPRFLQRRATWAPSGVLRSSILQSRVQLAHPKAAAL